MTLLETSNLEVSYGDRPILRGVSLSLAAGEVVSLLGPNGSGKSTLIRVLLGQLHASGVIRWNQKDLKRWTRRDLARQVAYLPQSPTADPDQTVADVLRTGRAPYWAAFGLESAEDVRAVDDVARQLDLADLLWRPIGELSGGQRQRVFIGRCLVQQPKAMLLDEPNTFLDLRHQVELLRLLRVVSSEREIGVLLAAHDLNLAATASDRMIVLENGVIAAEGKPAEVMDPQLLTRVYGIPMNRVSAAGAIPLVFPEVVL